MILCGCDYRMPMDDMIITGKKDIGNNMVEYAIQGRKTANSSDETCYVFLYSNDDSFQVHDHVALCKKQ